MYRPAIALVVAALAAAPAATANLTPLPGIVTPSGNIRCFYVPARPAHLLCDIRIASYTHLAQAHCMTRSGLDWHGFEVYATRSATTVCSGGLLYNSNRDKPRFRRLGYGHTWKFGAFSCSSRISGLTCTTPTGHGIFLSRESWRGW